MRTILVLALLSVFVSSPDALARKSKRLTNSLLSVAEPHPGEPANAHPFVNVIVFFGRLADFTPADPSTFKAKMGRENITGEFTPVLDANGGQIGVRAKIPAEKVKIGRRPRNTIRLSIQAAKTGEKGPRARDVDRVRFGAVLGPNHECSAQVGADTTLIVPGIPIQFEGTDGTTDPDRDELSFMWAFGDGTTSPEADPIHTYSEQSTDAVMATLTVSDGQATCTNQIEFETIPALDPGKTPGELDIASDTALEFAAVAPGATGTKVLTIKNKDATGTSSLPLRIATSSPSFQLSETSFTLGPGESRDVTVTFAPSATGHQDARIVVVANSSNRQVVTMLMHGFGGASPGAGPTFAADPVYFTEIAAGLIGLGTFGYMPDGRRFFADNGVHTCLVPGGGSGTGDLCLTDQDCAPNGGTCIASSTCQGGNNPGTPCTLPTDCMGGYCPSYSLFDPVDLCSDGNSLFILSDEGSFTEPDINAETERSISILRMDLDADGNVTKRDILDRTTTETGHIACDGFPAAQGGQVYIPEFHNVPDQGTCFRSEREALVKVAKSNGNTQVLAPRIDAFEGLADCDDLDPVMQLEVTRDGSHMLAGFESGGLWQIKPTALFYSADITELFQVHPDGSVLFAATTDSGSTGLVNLYRITPEQVQSGPLPYSALVPCASFAVPNNTLRDAVGRTVVLSLASARDAVGSTDATALVSFATGSGMSSTVASLFKVISPVLTVRGTVAFSAPANTTTCSVRGLITLDAQELAF